MATPLLATWKYIWLPYFLAPRLSSALKQKSVEKVAIKIWEK